jgi:hypothetical protein
LTGSSNAKQIVFAIGEYSEQPQENMILSERSRRALAAERSARSALHRALRHRFEKQTQLFRVEPRLRGSAVAARFFARRDQQKLRVLDALECGLRDAGLRRVAASSRFSSGFSRFWSSSSSLASCALPSCVSE